MKFTFMPAREDDKAYLLELRKLTMTEHLEKAGLNVSDDDHELRVNHAFDCAFLIVHKDSRIGAIKCREDQEKAVILQLQIHPEFQRKGFGQAVVEQIMSDVQPKWIELKVLKDNPAISLYERIGFSIEAEDSHEYFMTTRGTTPPAGHK